jgi:hypothetical protein
MYSRPSTTAPSYCAPWKTNPNSVPESRLVFSAISFSSSQVWGASENPLSSRRSWRYQSNPASVNHGTPHTLSW